jgi:hypothetical protein
MTDEKRPQRRYAQAPGRKPSHGIFSQRLIRLEVPQYERRLKERWGVRLRDLSGSRRDWLNLYARGLRQLDRCEAEIDCGGEAKDNAVKEYWTAYNAVQRALERLTASMASDHKERNQDAILTELRERYGGQRPI